MNLEMVSSLTLVKWKISSWEGNKKKDLYECGKSPKETRCVFIVNVTRYSSSETYGYSIRFIRVVNVLFQF